MTVVCGHLPFQSLRLKEVVYLICTTNSELPITQTFRGNRKRFKLSKDQMIEGKII